MRERERLQAKMARKQTSQRRRAALAVDLDKKRVRTIDAVKGLRLSKEWIDDIGVSLMEAYQTLVKLEANASRSRESESARSNSAP